MIVALSNLRSFLNRKNPSRDEAPGRGTVPIASPGDVTMGGVEDLAVASKRASEATLPRQLLTFTLEDYYQAEAFREVIRPDHWYRFESRLAASAGEALAFLDRSGVRATFCVSAWVAERFPELVANVAASGHEIALLGEVKEKTCTATLEEFRDQLVKGRKAVERASGMAVVGYRFPDGTLPPADSPSFAVLAEEGFAYATGRGTGQPRRLDLAGSTLCVFPEPAAGPLYQPGGRPAKSDLINVHTWEFDPGQPKIEAIPRSKRLRHYRNLGETPAILEGCFATGGFQGIAESLGLARAAATVLPTELEQAPIEANGKPVVRRPTMPVSLVVPCYNEEPSIRYLANTLKNVRERLGDRYDLKLVLVDDGSTDATWDELHQTFDGWPEVSLVQHERNQGVAASILTGIRHAETEIVCSIDCDCTYDPNELAGMIPLLTPGIDLVTASPYHPLGTVRNVQGARLFLSKSASFLYRRVFRQKLFTYTSCFRVYRRSAVEGMNLSYPGFLGVAEILGRLDLQGSRVVEYPTTLEVRVFGQSKMKLARTILAHLGLLAKLLGTRLGHASVLSSGVVPRSSLREDARDLGYSPQKG